MGSSKKTKDRDKKKRKREHSSSRSRDHRDKHHRHHHHHHKHKKHKRHREEHSPSISLSDLSDFDADFDVRKPSASDNSKPTHRAPPVLIPPPLSPPPLSPPPLSPPPFSPPSHTPPPLTPPVPPPPQREEHKGSNEISMSIEETNRLRAKLGLKPLQITENIKASQGEEADANDYKAGEVIHKPAQNIRDKIQVEKLREKIAAQREKRLQKQRLNKVKNLGESDEEAEDVNSWVFKSRKMEKERKEAEKRNKMLEELDAQFGVGDLVEEEMTQKKKRLYDSRDLSGLRVEHDLSRFSEGQTILTLKDAAILDGGEDMLVNPNLEDAERVEENLKRKRAKPGQSDDEDIDTNEFGAPPKKKVLDKYDEEIEGARKKNFRIGRLGEGPQMDPAARWGEDPSKKMARLRQLTSLEGPAPQLATEYLTAAESVSFKRVKKKKKKRKMLRADDLEPLEDAEQHLGSRGFRREPAIPFAEGPADTGGRAKTLRELMEEEEEEGQGPEAKMDEEPKAEEESESEFDAIELQEALTRSRRAKLSAIRASNHRTEMLAEAASGEKNDEDDMAMTLNVTDEFCRSLGDIPTYGLSGNRAEDDAVRRQDEPPKAPESWDAQGAWEEVPIEEARVEIAREHSAPILEEEPDTGVGIVNALKLAVKKGYLEKGSDKKPVNATLQHLKALHYSIEDKTVEEDRRGRGGDRYMGPTMDFKEKDTYKPDVKLEYVDDEGRKLSAKEAFRYLSHKFHGKGSGKNKLEKRMKKWQEELLMKHMSSSDTPLQTLERQREKQRQLGAAYLVLSGSKTQETLDVKK